MGHWSTLYPSKEAAFNEVEVVSLKIGKASGVAIGQLCLFALSRCSGKTVGISTNTKDAQTMCSQVRYIKYFKLVVGVQVISNWLISFIPLSFISP